MIQEINPEFAKFLGPTQPVRRSPYLGLGVAGWQLALAGVLLLQLYGEMRRREGGAVHRGLRICGHKK